MNQSPSGLGEYIRLINSDFSSFNIIDYEGSNYVTEFSINLFMEENNIQNKDDVVKALAEANGIKTLTVLDESVVDHDLMIVRDVMTIYESLNPLEVAKAAKGVGLLRSGMDAMASLIDKEEFKDSQVSKVQKKIEHCNAILDKIAEEKKKIREGTSNDHLKFSAMFAFNIAKNLFMIFIAPKIIMSASSKISKMPAAVSKLLKFFFGEGKAASELTKAQKAKDVALKGIQLVNDIPGDLKGLYLSFADYDKLLTSYENKIKDMKKSFTRQKATLEHSKGMTSSMVASFVTEDTNSPEAVEVHFQTPEELKVKDHTPEVVHDDTSPAEVETQTPGQEDIPVTEELPGDTSDAAQMELPKPDVEVPAQELPPVDMNAPEAPAPVKYDTAEFSPVDAIRQAHCDPLNVPIAKYGNKYYIDHQDLKCYMDSCENKPTYEAALETIINAHEDTNLCLENIRVVMGKSDISRLDEETKLTMEQSSVQFEVY